MKCPRCRAEFDGSPATCPSCGNRLGGGRRRIVALIFGIVLLVISVGLIAAGILLMWAGGNPRDRDGYLVSKTSKVSLDSYALLVELVPLDMNDYLPPFLRGLETEDLVNVRLKANRTASPKELFVGIARDSDAFAYLDNVQYDYAVEYHWRVYPWNVRLEFDRAVPSEGTAPSRPPTEETFWLASATGSPEASMKWTPESGEYCIIIMNADGSPGVDASLQLGAKFPILGWLPRLLVAIGILLGAGGTLLIYFGYARRVQIAGPAAP